MKIRVVLIAFGMLFFSSILSSSEPSSDLIKKVKRTVYEVVIAKPAEGTITYERELPLHLIPFSIRNDVYFSIGSAFAIEGGLFISAAHVVDLDERSRFVDAIYLRDGEGKVYEIDQVVAYSSNRDFIIFTVKGLVPRDRLEIHSEPHTMLNTEVFAVGNALGEGVVIRSGLFTSMTPEEEKGEWQWQRFSAAASPGNSGGPLLDRSGKVIGIILRKSENENLNYALPIQEAVQFSRKASVTHHRFAYSFPLLQNNEHSLFAFSQKLPAPYREFREKNFQAQLVHSRQVFKGMLVSQKERLFPYARNSKAIVHSSINAFFPHIIAENDKGVSYYRPEDVKKVELEKNGVLYYGHMARFLFVNFEKPDSVPMNSLASDSAFFMEQILKGIRIDRTVQSEKIRIRSLGKAFREEKLKDRFGRSWIMRIYSIPFSMNEVITCTMMVPSGFVAIVRAASSGMESETMQDDVREMTNYTLVSLRGTLEEWQEYEKLADSVNGITINYSSGVLAFSSPMVRFTVNHDLVSLSPKSILHINLNFIPSGEGSGHYVWIPVQYFIFEHENIENGLWITREFRPEKEDELNDSYHVFWQKLAGRSYPFDGTVTFENGKTSGQKVHRRYDGLTKENMRTPAYIIGVKREGNKSESKVAADIKSWDMNIEVQEKLR